MIEKNNIDTDGMIESINNLISQEIEIDSQSLAMSMQLLQFFIDQTECKKDVPPRVPHELQAVISLLHIVQTDIDIIRDVLEDYKRVLAA